MPFIHDDFLLHSETARRLYHEYAKDQPILDYHNHLPPEDIAQNRRFANLTEIWLGGDHYKWRAMRANGVEERLITGDADPYEKFLAWAATVPKTLRNPLYHWTHLELKRHFGIDDLLNEHTAPAIWAEANRQLADLSVHEILKRFKVAALCTTDDPADPLDHHAAIAAQGLRVFPAFRPDKAFALAQPAAFNAWLNRLGHTAGIEIDNLNALLDALKSRHDAFHAIGARLSDHGLNHAPDEFATDAEAATIFQTVRAVGDVSPKDQARFTGFLMLFFARLDAEKGWTKQLHLGPLRGVNTRRQAEIGPDTGFDTIGDFPQGRQLATFLDRLEREGALPKTIVYNNNPVDNYLFAALVGCFQEAGTPGKIQFGSGWWFLDTKQGIEWQLDALSNNGLLSRFIGMLTDSRSFMSFPRHEYFRRVLCNLLGAEMERGELPNDLPLIGQMVEDICFENARRYLGLEVAA